MPGFFSYAPPLAAISDDASFSVGAKLWLINSSLGSNGDGDGLMYGPILGVDFAESWWLSAALMTGELDYDTRGYEGTTEDRKDVEVFVGKSFELVDVGVGWRYLNSDNADFLSIARTSWGPALYAGAGELIGDGPFGWYASGSYLISDLSDDEGAGRHYNLEGGLFMQRGVLTLTAGYRFRDFTEIDTTDSGIAVSASVSFW